MRKRYGIYIFIVIMFLAVTGMGVLNYFYPFSFINRLLFKYNYSLDPNVKINYSKEYDLEFYYPPLFRTIPKLNNKKDMEEIMEEIESKVNNKYKNINLTFKEIPFLNYEDKINQLIKNNKGSKIIFNLNYDHFINKKQQIPIERYINKEEREKISTVDWHYLEKKGLHLWIIPIAYQNQHWLCQEKVNLTTKKIRNLDDLNLINAKMAFFYDNELFLRQLFALKGSDNYVLNKILNESSEEHLSKIVNTINKSKIDGKIYENSSSKIRNFINGEIDILAPTNPWLEFYLNEKIDNLQKIYLDNQIRTFGLSIFNTNKDSQEVKIAIESSKIIAEELNKYLVKDLNLKSAYNNNNVPRNYQEIFQLSPDDKKDWEELISLWKSYFK
ncbi:MAG: hypothetical protein ACQEQF_03810 [Bacillota bacterium]